MTIYQDREFTPVTVHQRHFDSWFLPQRSRQTGGVPADTSSDRALPNHYVLHGMHSFCLMPMGEEKPASRTMCR
jgi:hypothetical protein